MKKLPRPSAALVVASLALAVSCTGVAAAANGNLVLGAKNQATKTTQVKTTAAVTGPTLKLANPGGGPAAQFVTNSGKAPFKVNRNTKVTNLNADLLDGVSSSSFLRNDSTPLTAIVHRTGNQSTTSASSLILVATVEDYDPSNMWQDATTERLIAPVAGTYVVSATVSWANNTIGYRNTTLYANGNTIVGQAIGPPTDGVAVTNQNVTGIVHLDAGGYVQVDVLQGSGGALNVRLANFQMAYVGA